MTKHRLSRKKYHIDVMLRDPEETQKHSLHSGHRLKLQITQIAILATCYFLLATLGFAQEERFFEIKAKKFSFTPHIIKVNKGDSVRIRLLSEDVHHGFFLDGYGISTSAYPGQEGSLKFVADKPGRFSFRCSVTCGEFHPYMVGYLVVEPNSRFFVYVFAVLFFGLINFLWIIFRKEKINNG